MPSAKLLERPSTTDQGAEHASGAATTAPTRERPLTPHETYLMRLQQTLGQRAARSPLSAPVQRADAGGERPTAAQQLAPARSKATSPIQGKFTNATAAQVAMVGQFITEIMPEKTGQFTAIVSTEEKSMELATFCAQQLRVTLDAIAVYAAERDKYGAQLMMMDATGSEDSKSSASMAEQKPSEEEQALAKMSMSEVIMKAYADCGIRTKKDLGDEHLFNMLLELGQAGVHAALSSPATMVQMPVYYKNWLAYTACHDTAAKLVARMGDPTAAAGAFTGLDKAAAATATDGGAWMAAASAGLATAVSQDLGSKGRAIYEVHCGGHGFAVVVRGGAAEILQSFANYVALVERMQRGPLVLASGKAEQVLAALASPTESERNAAATIIADCDAATFGLAPYPKYQYRWRRRALQSDAALLAYFAADLKAAYDVVKKQLPLWRG